MDNSFFAYLEQLEQMAFFSGYPLLYATVFFIAGNNQLRNNFKKRVASLLPFSYALVGTLFLGFQLKKLHPDYSLDNIIQSTHSPFLMIWGILSIFFWIPALSRKPAFSLLHSLVFFFFLVKDMITHTFQSSNDKSIIRNDMKIYTDSLLLNLGVFILITLFFLLITRFKKR